MKIISKTSLISLAVVAAIAAAPQAAFAHTAKKAKAQTHHHHKAKGKSKKTVKRAAVAAPSATDARLRAMEAEIQALRGELNKTRVETKSAVTAVAEKAAAADAAVEAKLVKHEEDTVKKSTIFFRGGYASMTHPRNDELLVGNTTLNGLGLGTKDWNQGNGWYIGAGFDHRVTNDLWGMTDLVALDAELMVQYMNFGQASNTLVSVYPTPAVNALTGTLQPLAGRIKNQVTQLTVSASPKLKFNTGTIFTPWIIPFGLSINVISPPSSGVTVLNPGLMLGVGGEAEFMKAIVAGVDFRYNFTGGDLSYNSYGTTPGGNGLIRLKGMSTDGLTAGGYLGFKF